MRIVIIKPVETVEEIQDVVNLNKAENEIYIFVIWQIKLYIEFLKLVNRDGIHGVMSYNAAIEIANLINEEKEIRCYTKK